MEPDFAIVYTLSFQYSSKSETECLSSYNPSPGSEWKQVFNWKPSSWIIPTPRKLQWRQKQSYQRNELITDGFGFWKLYASLDSLVAGLKSDVLSTSSVVKQNLLAKSELMCKTMPLTNLFNSVGCDCFSEGESEVHRNF